MAVRIEREALAVALSGTKASDILDTKTRQSVVLSTFPQFQMAKNVHSQPMLASEPTAGWVSESLDATGIKPTTNMSLTTKSMTTAELATIVVVHDNLIADVDNWPQLESILRDKVTAAFAAKIDEAILFGVEAPTVWGDANIVGKAIAAGNGVQNPATGTQADLADQFNALFGRVEEDGYDVTDLFAITSLKSRLRGMRDSQGNPLYLNDFRDDNRTGSVYGYPVSYLDRRAAKPAVAQAIALDRSKYLVGIRQDISVSASNQATITGVGNLWERDSTALRFVFRLGFGSFVAPLELDGSYPAAVLQPKAV